MGRNVELLRKNLSVTRRLVQHIHKIAVLEDVLNLPAGEQILDILRNARRNTAPFTEALPDFHRICCGLFLLQKQMELINVVPGGLLRRPVDGHSVPDLIVIGNLTLLP